MGNYKFRLSDMMPNAWFYKLKDMSKGSKRNSGKKPSFSQQRQPECFATESSRAGSVYSRRISDTIFVETPLKSSRTGEKRRTIYRPSPVSAGFASPFSQGHDSVLLSPNYLFFSSAECSSPSLDQQTLWSSSCSCRISSSTADIIIDMNEVALGRRKEKTDGYRVISEIGLPPMLAKPVKPKNDASKGSSSKFEESHSTVKEEDTSNTFFRKSSANVAGVRLRANSPKLTRKRVRTRQSRILGLPESCAIVKSSVNPQRDFRESMVEMIVENNIRAPKDLEHLLACYLSLNSDEYRQTIIEAFEQIWTDSAYLQIQEYLADYS